MSMCANTGFVEFRISSLPKTSELKGEIKISKLHYTSLYGTLHICT